MTMHRTMVMAALVAVGFVAGTPSWAQAAPATAAAVESRNVMQLTATGTVDAPQDFLVLTLSVTKEAPDAATAQTQLRQAVDAALAHAKPQVAAGQMDVRTASFGLYPRYGKEGKMTGWQGRADVVLEGRDVQRIAAVASQISTMTIRSVGFSMSREARLKVEAEAQTMAIERFKARATELAKGFGFTGYSLREVSVSNSEAMQPVMRAMAQSDKFSSLSSDSSVPLEPGKSQVNVTVSGSVQMK